MINENEEKKREQFKGFLKRLSKKLIANTEEAQTIYAELEDIYYADTPDEEFRHFYSDIFSTLSEIEQNSDPGELETLGVNINYIWQNYVAIKHDISSYIKKLYDHISLDIARINYVNAQYHNIISDSEDITEIKEQTEDLKAFFEDIQKTQEQYAKKQKETDKRMERQQREYVAILGIFAAVVVAFVGGLVFSTSVFEGLGSANVYKLVIVAAVVGLVLMNILFALFRYISSIVKGEPALSYSKANVASNAVLAGIIVLAAVAWANGLFGAGA